MSKHTVGPWKVGTEGHRIYAGAYAVAGIFGTTGVSAPEAEANAHLIAAAPELLEALDYLLSQTVDQDLNHGIALTEGEAEARETALAAIRKARGGDEC